MIKITKIVFIMLLPLLLFCTGSKKKSDYPVVCYVYEHKYEFGIAERKGHLKQLRYYNTQEQLLKKQDIGKNGKRRNFSLFSYNEKGQLSRERTYSRSKQLLKDTRLLYDEKSRLYLLQEYDKNGSLSLKKEWVYKRDSCIWKMWTEYDQNGMRKRVENTEKDSDCKRRLAGIVYGRNMKEELDFHIEKHDSLGNETEKTFHKPNGELISRIKTTYDSKGRITEQIEEGKSKKKFTYSNGRLSAITHFDIKTGEKKLLIRYIYVKN